MTDGNGNHDKNRSQGGEPEGSCERDAVTTIAEIRGELKGALAGVSCAGR